MPALILRYWPHLIVLALVFVAGAWVGSKPANERAAKAELALAYVQRDMAQQRTLAEQSARSEELNRLAAVNAAAAKQAKELEDARKREADRADGLAAGNLRLRHEIAALATRGVSDRAAATAELDAAAERGSQLVAAAVAVGAACDATQAGLIEAYEAVR